MDPKPAPTKITKAADRTQADAGREFAERAAAFTVDGKPVAAPVQGARNVIAIRKGLTFAGDPAATVDALKAAYPECEFAWD
jgi:hypothetical protein